MAKMFHVHEKIFLNHSQPKNYIAHAHPIITLFTPSGDHTETVQITFDPEQTSYANLLQLFWNNHDSTACLSRQYMSAIFYHSEEQKQLAEQTRDEHQKKLTRKIQTRIKKAETFYDAEE